MSTSHSFLRSGPLLTFLFIANAHALPIWQINVTREEIHFSRYNDGELSPLEPVLIPGDTPWNGDADKNNLLSGVYFSEFTFPDVFNSAFLIQLSDSDRAGLTILAIPKADPIEMDDASESSGDANETTRFLTKLGIAMADWEGAEENLRGTSQHNSTAPVPVVLEITRGQGPRTECVRRHHEHSQNLRWRENLCFEGGRLASTGGVGSRRGSGSFAGRASGMPGFSSGGSGMGGGRSGAGIGGSAPGTGKGTGIGSDVNTGGANSGIGNGGNSGTGGSDVIGEARSVPEPTTLALIGFGIASMCTARRYKN